MLGRDPTRKYLMRTRAPMSAFYAVFFVAGAPALLYQVTWQRVLSLYFGVDIYSTAVTVAAFMAGLGLGSLVGGTLADRTKHLARLYAVIEGSLGLFGALSLAIFTGVGRHFAGRPLTTVALGSFILLVVPTVLMGMTLPVMSRILISDQALGRPVAWLYGLNTLGAAAGALFASYFLIGKVGLQGTVYAASGLNLILAAVVWSLSGSEGAPDGNLTRPSAADGRPASPISLPPSLALVTALSLTSGFVALGYEIVWYRVLTVLLHGTVYVFGTILFVFLTGIAFGSLSARRSIDRPGPMLRFGWAQLGMSWYVFLFFTGLGRFSGLPGLKHLIAASFFTSLHPSPEFAAGQRNIFAWYSLVDTPAWAVAMLGVPTFLMGYGFPQLIRAATQSAAAAGASIGRVYFANIVGSTAGSLFVGFICLEHLGTERTLLILLLLGAAAGVVATWTARKVSVDKPRGRLPLEIAAAGALVVVSIVAFPRSGSVIRAIHLADFSGVDFVAREDKTGVVALRNQHRIIAFEQERKVLDVPRLHIDGATHGVGDAPDLTDLTVRVALAHTTRPRRILSIGLGDAVMCSTAIVDPGVSELVVVELNAGLASVLAYTARGRTVIESPKLRSINDDGRRWLLANPSERFDMIMMFPLYAGHAYYGNLFSKEFFQLAAAHLTQSGVLVFRSVDLMSTPRTVIQVFPYVVRIESSGYVASQAPLLFDASRLPVSTQEFSRLIQADRATIAEHTKAAALNLDLRPNSEYYLSYPYAWSLATTGIPPELLYVENSPARFAELIVNPPLPSTNPHAPAGQDALPKGGTAQPAHSPRP